MSSRRNKEAELLKAARDGDVEKLERLVSPFPRKKSSSSSDGSKYDVATLQNMNMKVQVQHIDVNCADKDGSTPLILAALNGRKEAVVLLLIFSADIAKRDKQK
jgi:ankyrin repeat protein